MAEGSTLVSDEKQRLSVGMIVGRALVVVVMACLTAIVAGGLVFGLYVALSGGHYEREPAILGVLTAGLCVVVLVPAYGYLFFRKHRPPSRPPRELF